MDFGKLAQEVISLKEVALEDAAAYAEVSLEKLNMMLNRSEWTTTEVKQFSVALNYDFGKHLSPWEIEVNALASHQDANFYVQYSPQHDGEKLDKLTTAVHQLCDDLGLKCQ
jgi:hypothetical protein